MLRNLISYNTNNSTLSAYKLAYKSYIISTYPVFTKGTLYKVVVVFFRFSEIAIGLYHININVCTFHGIIPNKLEKITKKTLSFLYI